MEAATDLRRQIADLKNERDMLLEALRDLERTAGQAAEFDDPVRARARNAITKAAGQQR